MKRIIVCIVPLLAALPACTLITDFSAPDGDLYSLDENMSSQINVSLAADSTATLTLSFTEQLPGGADDNEDLLALITAGTVDLVVANNATGVDFNLAANGTHVENPAGPGQYSLALAADRNSINIVFYNEVSGVTLHAGGDYTATVTVLTNQWFEVEEFIRAVNVQ